MKSLKPDGRIDLEHRAYFLRGSTESSTIVAASEDGRVSLVDFGSNSAMANRPTTKIRKISPHPKESPFAYAESKTGALHVRTLPGELIAELEPPSLSDDASRSMTQGFKDWHFDEGGDFLWLVAPVSDNECELSLVETKSWSVTQSVVLEDHFGQSSFSFHSKENPGHISLWVAGGQDGQEVYFLKRDVIGFSFNRIEKLANCLPPVFSHDGSELLTVTESKSICRYGFPSINLLGPPCISSDKNDPFAESLCYLDSRYALVGTCEQRIFFIDTMTMRIEDEVAVEGHEPRPIREYYPELANERGVGTDITWFARIGDVIVFVFRRDRGTGLKGWQDSLLWYSVKK